jgi:hypothetical protein
VGDRDHNDIVSIMSEEGDVVWRGETNDVMT